ncbi:aminotransferase class III-fold pyridoxal phosphate-dependent enzyme [Dactylosporangium sp. NPDC050588]|uniref:aspartate aminotransferase family protein n=1 Tax=Dactylosporangium sp. NPDC050588 TaxID=3157211 RepID=UPI0033E6B986
MPATLSPILKQATPVEAVSGRGAVLVDVHGREYLDFTAGIGVTSTGHCHPKVVAAAQEQVATLIHGQYTTVLHQPLRRLVARLGEVLPAGLDSVFFVNSGSEAVEAALRLARQATGRPNIIAFQGGFHGRTIGAASLTTSGTKFRTGFAPLMGGVFISAFPAAIRLGMTVEDATDFALRELDHLLQTVSAPSDTAAFIVEPVLGEGGYIPAPARFLHGLRERADHHGILLIFDEVQTGAGRTGRFWAQEHAGVRGDILVTAKGIASGFPLSAMAASTELMAKALPGSQGGTYGANAVACAAAVATLEVIEEEKLVDNSRTMGQQLLDGLAAVAATRTDRVRDVRGLGLMVGVELWAEDRRPDPSLTAAVQRNAIDEGLLLLTCGTGNNVVRFIPPLVVDRAQIDAGIAAFTRALDRALEHRPAGASS